MDGMWVQLILKDLMAVEVTGGMGMVGDCESKYHVGAFVYGDLIIVELVRGKGMVSDCEWMACRCNCF